MSRKFKYGLVSLFVGASLVLSACGGGQKQEPLAPAQPAPAEKKPAVGGELRFKLSADPDSLVDYFGKSAFGAEVSTGIFGWGGLVMINEKNEPAPYFAKEWKNSPDNLEWTFTLRDDIKFQDGKQLTAEDVEFTFKTLTHPDYNGRWGSTFTYVKDAKAVDPRTVQITLKEPYSPFLFTTAAAPILPKHGFPAGMSPKDMGASDFAKQPFGAGPYKFAEWKPGQYVKIERYPDYFEFKDGKGPWMQSVLFKVITETQTGIAALEAGEIDIYPNTEAQFVSRLQTEFKDKLNGYDWDRNGFGYMTLNNEKFPTNDKAVRRAMTQALNKDAILKGPLDGRAKVPAGPIPPVSWAFDPNVKGLAQDMAAAKKALDDAGYTPNARGIREKDGQPLTVEYYATKGNPLIEAIALQAKKDWTELGLDVQVDFIDFNILLEKHMEPGNFNVTFSGFSLGIDPGSSLYNIFHSSSAKANEQGLVKGNNVARYKNPELDQLIEEGVKVFDVAQRKEIYSKIQKQLIEDAPQIWIYANNYTDFVTKRIKGVINRPGYGASFWYRWYINEQ